jgi:hypothetical protein
LQGIDPSEVIDAVRSRRQPTISPGAKVGIAHDAHAVAHDHQLPTHGTRPTSPTAPAETASSSPAQAALAATERKSAGRPPVELGVLDRARSSRDRHRPSRRPSPTSLRFRRR